MSRTILIAGGGIGGLVTALALARNGFRAVIFEQSTRLEPVGAGLQLSPNAMHVLQALGLEDALRPYVVPPEYIRIRKARTGSDIVRVPLGPSAQQRYGAPYWMIHRGDLQAVLLDAVRAEPDVELTLGGKVQDYAAHAKGVTAQVHFGATMREEHGIALIGADGLWSTIRQKLGDTDAPHFRQRTAWRAVVPSDKVPGRLCETAVNLWLGPHAHLVHYPIRGGDAINIVAIVHDDVARSGWNNTGSCDEILARFGKWAKAAQEVVSAPERWATWTLYDRPRLNHWGEGPVTMIGDAAHPMLPFLAQGAAMAIEDAVVLADCIAQNPGDIPASMRRYEALRGERTARTQKGAADNGQRYHMAGAEAAVRNMVMRVIGGDGLLRRYDWLYSWRMPPLRQRATPTPMPLSDQPG